MLSGGAEAPPIIIMRRMNIMMIRMRMPMMMMKMTKIEVICTEYRTAPHTPLNSATCVCWITSSALNCKLTWGVLSLITRENSDTNKETKITGKNYLFLHHSEGSLSRKKKLRKTGTRFANSDDGWIFSWFWLVFDFKILRSSSWPWVDRIISTGHFLLLQCQSWKTDDKLLGIVIVLFSCS